MSVRAVAAIVLAAGAVIGGCTSTTDSPRGDSVGDASPSMNRPVSSASASSSTGRASATATSGSVGSTRSGGSPSASGQAPRSVDTGPLTTACQAFTKFYFNVQQHGRTGNQAELVKDATAIKDALDAGKYAHTSRTKTLVSDTKSLIAYVASPAWRTSGEIYDPQIVAVQDDCS